MKPRPGWRPTHRSRRATRQEIDDEIRFHLEGRTEEFERQGLSPAEARGLATKRFGDISTIKASCAQEAPPREKRPREWFPMQQFAQDLRYAIRILVKHPGYAVAVIATLTLAVGATTAVFSVVNGVLLRPLPVPDPDQLVRIWEVDQRPGFFDDRNRVTVANYGDWRTENAVFTQLAAFQNFPVTMRGRGDPRPVMAGRVTAEFFDVLGVRAAIGRTFLPEDDDQDAPTTLVLSHRFWVQEMGQDSSILGQTLSIGGGPAPIVGVLPASFDILNDDFDVWFPLRLSPSQYDNRRSHLIEVIGRLKPGITLEQAQIEMDRIVSGLTSLYPEFLNGWGVNVVSLTTALVGDVRPALLVLQGAVIVLLVIATLNITNLMFARTAAEERERIIRTALGAGRKRLISQKLGEALSLASIGGVLGVTLAIGMTRLLLLSAPDGLPMIEHVRVDWTVLLFALLATTASGFVFALAPALQAGKTGLASSMNSRGTAKQRKHTAFRSGLVVTQLAFSLTLLISAGLLLNTFMRLIAVDPGFNPAGSATMSVSLSGRSYPTAVEQARFYDRVLDRVRALPGVRTAGATRFLPMVNEEWTWSIQIVGQPEPQEGEKRDYGRHAVVSDYFQAMNIGLREGRLFNDMDRHGGPLTVIVNEAFVNRFFPDGPSPVGQRMMVRSEGNPMEIVGVVNDVHQYSLDAQPLPAYYVDLFQFPDAFGFGLAMNLVIRTEQDPGSVLAASRSIIRELDPTVVVANATTMESHVSRSVVRSRFAMLLLGTFACIALALAVVGVYGVVSYSVSQRTQEIGVRLALGAKPPTILAQVIGEALQLAGVGVVLGVVMAVSLTRFQTSLLYEISPVDPLTYTALSGLLLLAAGAAAFIPARRASLTDPIHVLRDE